ncbi:hypothetical protein EVAR_27357_1 [Eumeta japonica]|uniref:Uncharacterized protein n=1 Tax=Eumeta variegata TaxID=151549 RepID=A0A4C1UDT2_EUMVA|nr:hypothetical protein EVAR_27357_1 [Eumeta japonica]
MGRVLAVWVAFTKLLSKRNTVIVLKALTLKLHWWEGTPLNYIVPSGRPPARRHRPPGALRRERVLLRQRGKASDEIQICTHYNLCGPRQAKPSSGDDNDLSSCRSVLDQRGGHKKRAPQSEIKKKMTLETKNKEDQHWKRHDTTT